MSDKHNECSDSGPIKTAIFSWNFDLFFTFFIDHIHVPNLVIWGSTSRPPIGDVLMSLFLFWGRPFMSGDGPKSGPFWTKKGQTWQASQRSKVATSCWQRYLHPGTYLAQVLCMSCLLSSEICAPDFHLSFWCSRCSCSHNSLRDG